MRELFGREYQRIWLKRQSSGALEIVSSTIRHRTMAAAVTQVTAPRIKATVATKWAVKLSRLTA
jgi:hypothetical protein